MGVEKLDTTINRLQALAGPKMEAIVEKAAEAQFDLMEALNRQQLLDGIRSDGSFIDPPYRPRTVEIKKLQGRPWNKVTLLDEGFYHARIEASKAGKAVALESWDEKAEALQAKYGENIEGLTEENTEIVSIAMLPDIEKETRKYLKI
jgi:hypothetical protein